MCQPYFYHRDRLRLSLSLATEWHMALTGGTTLLFELRNQFVSNVHCNLFVAFEGNLAKINGNGLFFPLPLPSPSPLPWARADKVLVKRVIVPSVWAREGEKKEKVTNMFKVAQWSLNLKKNTLSDMIEHFYLFPPICQPAPLTYGFSIFADISLYHIHLVPNGGVIFVPF